MAYDRRDAFRKWGRGDSVSDGELSTMIDGLDECISVLDDHGGAGLVASALRLKRDDLVRCQDARKRQ